MTIDEMRAWLEKVEPGEAECAVKDSFELALQDADCAETLAAVIAPLEPHDFTIYLLALGHLIAVLAMNVAITEVARRKYGQAATAKLPLMN